MSQQATAWAADVWLRNETSLRRLAHRLLNSPTDVDDVVASTYEVLVRCHGNLRQGLDENVLILGIGANVARHHLRTEGRKNRTYAALAFAPLESMQTPQHSLELRELERDLSWAIEQLEPAQRIVVSLLREGKTSAEVSRLLDESEGTIRSRAHHARKKLRRLLSQRWLLVVVVSLALAALAGGTYVILKRLLRGHSQASPVSVPSTTRAAPEPVEAVKLATPSPPAPAKAAAPHQPEPVAPVQPLVPTAVVPPSPAPPSSVELFDAASRAQFVELDLEKAVTGWSRYLERFSSDPLADDARFNRVVALFRLGRLREAQQFTDEALHLGAASPHRAELEQLQALMAESTK